MRELPRSPKIESSRVRKLLQLKRWLTLPDAANYLSDSLGEAVSQADILRLALDGELTLSVHFVNTTTALAGEVIPHAEAKQRSLPTLDGKGVFTFTEGTPIPGGRVIRCNEERIVTLNGVWDLTMFGAEEFDVEHLYQTLTDGPAVELQSLEGVFVTDGAGVVCKLMSRFTAEEIGAIFKSEPPFVSPKNYFPAGTLPEDGVFVVRIGALQALESKMAGDEKPADGSPDKPVQRRERNTLLVMIAALAQIAKVDVKRPSKAATAIESQTALLGARVAARTIEGHLNRINEALESRG